MDPALKAEAAAWKKLRGYDKGINTMMRLAR
jgi:hypothetical protein